MSEERKAFDNADHAIFPRNVFRVMYREDGTPFVAERKMVSRSGSWFVTERKDGSQEKENGNHWSDTVVEAIQCEARYVMNRFCLQTVFKQEKQIQSMDGLIHEAMEWGRLLGMVEAAVPKKLP